MSCSLLLVLTLTTPPGSNVRWGVFATVWGEANKNGPSWLSTRRESGWSFGFLCLACSPVFCWLLSTLSEFTSSLSCLNVLPFMRTKICYVINSKMQVAGVKANFLKHLTVQFFFSLFVFLAQLGWSCILTSVLASGSLMTFQNEKTLLFMYIIAIALCSSYFKKHIW